MSHSKKDFELLSAYLDDELSFEEKEQVEKNIKSSLELQKKLEDLKKTKKLTSSSYKKIPESPYFETRLFAALNSQKPWYKKIANWSPAIGLAFATVIIMVVLQSNPTIFKDLIEQQKTNLSGFYKENLQPLLFAADLNNEDIFNFAMYKQLPLDKENNHVLQLGYDTTGSKYFEIKNAELSDHQNNLESFIVALDLDERERNEIDSIMKQYAEELEAQVLVNENSTVALNANLWNYQRAIQSDLMAFAEKSNWNEFQKFVPQTVSYSSNPSVVYAVNEVRNSKNKNYIILTPDSIFSEPLDFDVEKFNFQLAKVEKELENQNKNIHQFKIQVKYDSTLKNLKNKLYSNFNITFDSNLCRIRVSEFDFPDFEMPDFDSLFSTYDSVANNFKYYSQYIPKIEYFDNRIKFHFDGDSSKSFEFKTFNFNVDSLLESQSDILDSLKRFNWNGFYNQNDSLVLNSLPGFERFFKNFRSDEDMMEQMKELKIELQQFREEIKIWKEEFKREFRSRNNDENNLD
jgi:hypothetical protein